MSPALALYLALAEVAAPALRLLLAVRAARGREDPARLGERRGVASAPRPEGRLVWLHGASVGEGMLAAALAREMGAARPDLSFLLTTGTVASAALLAGRTPPRTLHQFAPLDAGPWGRRFLRHWRPDLAVRVDSDLWPAILLAARRGGARLALVNGRVSARSARRWALAPRFAARLLGAFDLILAQDAASAARFAALAPGAGGLRVGGALKAAVPPPPADAAKLAALRAAVAGRPVWLAASTHPGEETLVLAAARAAAVPGLLTLIAPRHPDRGPAVAAEAAALGLRVTRRAAGEGPEGADVHVADTLGEMGLWLRLAPFAFVGGSAAPLGGHNPWEPAALGVLIAHGPHVENFAEPYAALTAAGASRPVADAADLAAALRLALAPGGGLTPAAAAAAEAGRQALAADAEPLRAACAALLALLDRP